jgi:hypothetical protein
MTVTAGELRDPATAHEAGESEVSASLPGGGRRARRAAAAAEAAAEAAGETDVDGPPTGSLFVPSPAMSPEPSTPSAEPVDDDWDLGRYARGFQPSENPVPADDGYGDGYGAAYPDQDYSGGYQVPSATPYDATGQGGQGYDDYGQGAYPQGGYDAAGGYGQQPGYESYDQYQAAYGAYDTGGHPVHQPQPGDDADAATQIWQPGEDGAWPPPPQQPPRPGGTR